MAARSEMALAAPAELNPRSDGDGNLDFTNKSHDEDHMPCPTRRSCDAAHHHQSSPSATTGRRSRHQRQRHAPISHRSSRAFQCELMNSRDASPAAQEVLDALNHVATTAAPIPTPASAPASPCSQAPWRSRMHDSGCDLSFEQEDKDPVESLRAPPRLSLHLDNMEAPPPGSHRRTKSEHHPLAKASPSSFLVQ
ncbi:uncharacterized protein MONBRDRAFT_5198 [Monosiga brevicollis MX1]|uniref:Uncharacterized protein n=1 Tax=Monosiga brevicollis TaxID=81824 RepID=A9UQ80_MONBE|nr:uncharacterized protein MONBRDRAFT_5198 [Monosiga brevicollis MX1]EDQ93001.1 predicted protein [Monosiga brevicollis MX1]|eukprot:XP_001742763.1 hypothetical protein [Monosiga brevicollis MX1]